MGSVTMCESLLRELESTCFSRSECLSTEPLEATFSTVAIVVDDELVERDQGEARSNLSLISVGDF